MMISKTKISTEGFEKVEITAEMAEIFGLPKKAIGKWAVVAEDDVERRLMKVRLDGYFADDKYNNHQRISNRIWGQMFGGVRCAKFEFSDGFKFRSRVSGAVSWLRGPFAGVYRAFGRDRIVGGICSVQPDVPFPSPSWADILCKRLSSSGDKIRFQNFGLGKITLFLS